MSVINVDCVDQTLTIVNFPTIASGGVNENSIEFTFCTEWSGYSKTAVFFMDKGKRYYSVIDTNNRCIIPWETLTKAGKLFFGVVGTKEDGCIRTSELVKYNIVEGGHLEEAEPSEPTEDVWAQCLAQIERAIQAAANASGIPYVVTVTSTGTGGYVTNHTAAEINIAFEEGRTIYTILNGTSLFVLAMTEKGTAIFRNLESGNTLTIKESEVIINEAAFYTHPTHTVRESGFYKITVDGLGHITDVSAVTKKDLTDLGVLGALPTHAENHKTGGADEIKPADIGAASVNEAGKVKAQESSSAQVTEAGSRTLALTDAGCDIVVNSASAVTISVPADAEVNFPIDTEIIVFRAGSGTVTIDLDSVTCWSSETARGIADQYTSVLLKKRAANTWSFEGNIG